MAPRAEHSIMRFYTTGAHPPSWDERHRLLPLLAAEGPRARRLVNCDGRWSRCGQICCAVCHGLYMARRRSRLIEVARAAEGRGYGCFALTLRCAVNPKSSLSALMADIKEAWREARRGNPADRLRRRHGCIGLVPVLEIEHSASLGWLPHFHNIIIAETVDGAEALADAFGERYSRNLACPDPRLIKPVPAYDPSGWAGYLSKHWSHEPDGEVRSPRALERDFFNGDERAGVLFAEVYAALYRFRTGIVSPQLRRALGLCAEHETAAPGCVLNRAVRPASARLVEFH
jgi:hypothetical protein